MRDKWIFETGNKNTPCRRIYYSLRTIVPNQVLYSKIGVPLSVSDTLSTYCKHMKMVSVFIRAVKTSVRRVHRKSGIRRNYTAFNPRRALKPPTFRSPPVLHRTTLLFPPDDRRAFYHLAPGATVIAWISEALGQLKIAELGSRERRQAFNLPGPSSRAKSLSQSVAPNEIAKVVRLERQWRKRGVKQGYEI